MPTERIKVLYIGGYGRSGSTLLSRLLGQLQGFHSVGEMSNIWQRCFIENQLCGCGQPFRECDFWRAVVDEAFGGFEQVAVEEINHLAHLVRNHFYFLLLNYPHLRSAEQQQLISTYMDVIRKLYTAIQRVSGCRVIVDASKGPRYAMLLKQIAEIDLRVVHLVRDSRGVAYSWQKKQVKPEVYWKTEYMDRLNPTSSALIWNITNLLMQTFRKHESGYLFMRYEDLIESPRVWLGKIATLAGEPGWESDNNGYNGESEAFATFAVEHSAGGNPSRYRQGPIKLRHDDEWRYRMPDAQKTVVTALTRPLLRRYGYYNSTHVGGEQSVPVEGCGTLRENGRPL